MTRRLLILACAGAIPTAMMSGAEDNLRQGDMWYGERATNFDAQTREVDPVFISKAIESYRRSFDEATGPTREEACWKLIQACYFHGQFGATESEARKRVYDMGKRIGALGLGAFPESVAIHAWTAIIWGVWGEEYGIIRSAREGVAGRIRQHGEKVIELDAAFQDAAGYRVLGRLHYKAPRIPLILGWPSKDKALEYLEEAYRRAPGNLYNRQYLAEVLHDQDEPGRARELMETVVRAVEIDQGIVEDAFIKRQAREILSQWDRE